MNIKMFFSKVTLVFLAAGLFFASCNKDEDDRRVRVPDTLSVTSNNFFTEDIVVEGNQIFLSGFGDGTVRTINLNDREPTSTVFAGIESGFAQSWGLASDGDVVLNILNNPNFMDLTDNGMSKLVEYDFDSGNKTNEWSLGSTVSNSVQIVDGKYYVCEWAPTPRIVQIDPFTGSIDENWFTSAEWDATIGGLGGVIYNDKDAFYISQGNKLWHLPISNSTAGILTEVTISGSSSIDADGITWAGNNTLYYATNDAFDPADNGTVFKVKFDTPTSASVSMVKSGLDDASGVWYFENGRQEYLFVAESQIGALFGVSAYEAPYNIEIIEL